MKKIRFFLHPLKTPLLSFVFHCSKLRQYFLNISSQLSNTSVVISNAHLVISNAHLVISNASERSHQYHRDFSTPLSGSRNDRLVSSRPSVRVERSGLAPLDKLSTLQTFNLTNRPGSSLVIALLIAGTIATISFGAAQIFLASITSLRSTVDSTQAYYTSEGALEKGLYIIESNPRYRASDDTFSTPDFGTSNLKVASTQAVDPQLGIDVNNGSLGSDETFDLFTRDIGDSVRLTFSSLNGGGLEIIAINSTNNTRLPGSYYSIGNDGSCDTGQISLSGIDAIRLVAKGGNLSNLRMFPSSATIDIGKITITATGKSDNGAVQRLQAIEFPGTSGGRAMPILDYALFSGENIQ